MDKAVVRRKIGELCDIVFLASAIVLLVSPLDTLRVEVAMLCFVLFGAGSLFMAYRRVAKLLFWFCPAALLLAVGWLAGAPLWYPLLVGIALGYVLKYTDADCLPHNA